MKRTLQAFVVCLLLTLPGISQTAHKPNTTAHPAAKNLSDTFAKSALRALFVVNSDYLAFDSPGTVAFQMSRESDKAVSDLDADATTKQERQVVETLSGYATQKSLHNLAKKAVSAEADLNVVRPFMDRSDVLNRVTALKSMDEKEHACRTAFEAALRARSWRTLPACSDEALHVEIPSVSEKPVAATN
jgi:hypothetical protein